MIYLLNDSISLIKLQIFNPITQEKLITLQLTTYSSILYNILNFLTQLDNTLNLFIAYNNLSLWVSFEEVVTHLLVRAKSVYKIISKYLSHWVIPNEFCIAYRLLY